MKAIIPAAGFGTRVGMKPDQSKELMLYEGKPLIEYSLDLCAEFGLKPLVITRPDKADLIRYLVTKDVEVLVIVPCKEWAETVLKSEPLWDDKNILLLPDTRFEPRSIIGQIKASLEFGFEACYAIHNVDDISNWGFVTKYTYCEKPRLVSNGTAWGIIGFTKLAGNVIIRNMQHKSSYNSHDHSSNFVFLDSFQDVTRGSVGIPSQEKVP